MAKRPNRVAWALAAGLSAVLLGGTVMLGVRLRPYWQARYRGKGADLRRAVLIHAPLAGAISKGPTCALQTWGALISAAPAYSMLISGERTCVGPICEGRPWTILRMWPALRSRTAPAVNPAALSLSTASTPI
jgi:hypothetical protein